MTLLDLAEKLLTAMKEYPGLDNLPIEIEHRNCEDDNPEDVGIYPYKDHVGLSFWKD